MKVYPKHVLIPPTPPPCLYCPTFSWAQLAFCHKYCVGESPIALLGGRIQCWVTQLEWFELSLSHSPAGKRGFCGSWQWDKLFN